MAACFRSPPPPESRQRPRQPPSRTDDPDSRRLGQTTQAVAESDRRPRQSPTRTDDPDSRRLGQTTQTAADSDRRPRQSPSQRSSWPLSRPEGWGERTVRVGDSDRRLSESATIRALCESRPYPVPGPPLALDRRGGPSQGRGAPFPPLFESPAASPSRAHDEWRTREAMDNSWASLWSAFRVLPSRIFSWSRDDERIRT